MLLSLLPRGALLAGWALVCAVSAVISMTTLAGGTVPIVAGTAPVVGTALLVGAPPNSAERRWAPPLGRSIDLVGRYRAPPHPYASGHRGIDLPASPGETVLAPASGTVSFAGTVVDRGVLSIRVDDRTVVSIEPVTVEVGAGGSVTRGARVGTVGRGGHCGAECVHVGVRVEGEYVNPMRYFANRPVLLPWE